MATKRRSKSLKPKIAIFHCSFAYSGGGERIVIEEVLGLRKRGYEVGLYAPAINEKECFPFLLPKASPKSILPRLPRWFPLRDAIDMAASSALIGLLAPGYAKYDVFVGANQPGVWFAYVLSKVLKKPYVIYLNQPNRMIYPRSVDLQTGWRTNANFVVLEKAIALFKPIIAWMDKISTRNANTLLANGRYIGDVIGQIYGKDYIECPAGADPFDIDPKVTEETYYEGKVKANGHTLTKPYVLLTNRHYPQKKFEYAIKAIKTVVSNYKDIKLVISGSSTNYTTRLKRLVKKLGLERNVFFVGEVSDEELSNLYSQAAVYVYTSPQEDYGMGVVEAQYAGVPVVAWNHAGPTVTVRSGVTGFLAKPYEVSDYAGSILNLLKDKSKRIQMGKNAREHVIKNFSWSHHIDVLERAIIEAYRKNGQER
jgi:glycosyltransferase involved in cell wall biosynthesis